MLRLCRFAAVLPIVCSAAPGAELVVRDLDLQLLALPTAFTFDLSSNARNGSGEDAFDSGSALEIGYRHSVSRAGDPVGLVVGLAASSENYIYATSGYLVGYHVKPLAGVGWAPSDRWTLLGEFGYEFGQSTLKLPATTNAPSYSASGTYRGWDARVSARWAAGDRFLIGVLAGWQSGTWALTGENSTALNLQQSGWYAGVGISWRFSTDPTTLE